MLPLSLYPVLFDNDMLWYGDFVRSNCFTRDDFRSVPDWHIKINSLILKKLGITNIYSKSEDGELKTILDFPFYENGCIHSKNKKYSVCKHREYECDFRFFETSFFYIRTKGRKSYWNLYFYNTFQFFDALRDLFRVIRNEAERCEVDDDEVFELFWDGLPFDFIKAYKDYQIVEDWCLEFGLDKLAARSIYKETISLYNAVKYYPREDLMGWFYTQYGNAIDYDMDPWNTYVMFETMVLSLPVLKDWNNFKKQNEIEDGELEKRAEFLFSKLTSERDCKIWRTYSDEMDPDRFSLYPGENSSVHLSLYMMEVDEVVEQLKKKYSFTKKRRKEFNCSKDLEEVI